MERLLVTTGRQIAFRCRSPASRHRLYAIPRRSRAWSVPRGRALCISLAKIDQPLAEAMQIQQYQHGPLRISTTPKDEVLCHEFPYGNLRESQRVSDLGVSQAMQKYVEGPRPESLPHEENRHQRRGDDRRKGHGDPTPHRRIDGPNGPPAHAHLGMDTLAATTRSPSVSLPRVARLWQTIAVLPLPGTSPPRRKELLRPLGPVATTNRQAAVRCND